jgi:hypothetical protein
MIITGGTAEAMPFPKQIANLLCLQSNTTCGNLQPSATLRRNLGLGR